MDASVRADQTYEFERSQGMVRAEFKGFANVFGGGDAFLEKAALPIMALMQRVRRRAL